MARPRIAIVSINVPPSPYGQSGALGHLLKDEYAPHCLLISERPPASPADDDNPYGSYRKLKEPNHCCMLFSVLRRAREIARGVRDFQAQVIVACTASPFDIPASTLAALMTRTPLAVYLFDDPIFQWEAGRLRRFARYWEPLWSRLASATIAPNEFMAREFQSRTGRSPVVIRNPVADSVFEGAVDAYSRNAAAPTSIVYTGAVYQAQADAFRTVLQALELLGGRFLLDIYTSQTREELTQQGVHGRYVRVHEHLDQGASYAVQRNAGILFLPLAFESRIQEVLRSAAPAKLGEYLASGRPILVHAPADTFVVSLIRANEAGMIVDTADPRRLAEALELILSDANATATLVRNAFQLAKQFRASLSRELFWRLMSGIQKGT
jgi:glycosyltransferase involved in cell wall biosynthesis